MRSDKVFWKGFIVENNIQRKKEDLENVKKIVVKFEKRMSTEIR